MHMRLLSGKLSAIARHGSLLAVLAIGGCDNARVPVHDVSGRVTYQGQPPVGALIVLHPVDDTHPTDVTPTGTVSEDGSFQITAYEPGDGAPLGDYVATIHWFKLIQEDGGAGRGPNVLPPRYASPDTSPVRITVKEGGSQIPPIEIRR
jgi:hypothetical protein